MSRLGEVLDGKYEVTRLLGKGGMGEVFVARHRVLGKDVAIKVLRAALSSDDEAVARFAQEARAAAAVGHRGIVDVYDVGTTPDGAPYLVMELVDGETLRSVLTRAGKLPVDVAVATVVELLGALAAAHGRGVVHRDLKPDNVLVERTEGPLSIKLLDFGIAKMHETGRPHLTRSGLPLGTALYMSPEQARGERDLDARVDVWSACVILYELLTGRLPFTGDNYNAIILQVLRADVPPPRELTPEIPAELEAVVMRALEKDRERRIESAAQLRAALSPFAQAIGVFDLLPRLPDRPRAAQPATATARPHDVAGHGVARRSYRVALLAGIVTVALGLAWLASVPEREVAPPRPSRTEQDEQPRRARPDGGAARRPPEPLVTIAIEGAPAGARIFLEGARVPELPIQIAPRSSLVTLRVEADGYEPSAQMLVPDHDRTIRVALTKLAERPHAHPPRRPPGPASTIQTDTREFDE